MIWINALATGLIDKNLCEFHFHRSRVFIAFVSHFSCASFSIRSHYYYCQRVHEIWFSQNEHFDFTCESRTEFHLLHYKYGYSDGGCAALVVDAKRLNAVNVEMLARSRSHSRCLPLSTAKQIVIQLRNKTKRAGIKIVIPTAIQFPSKITSMAWQTGKLCIQHHHHHHHWCRCCCCCRRSRQHQQ